MNCCLFGTKPLFKPMMTYHQMDQEFRRNLNQNTTTVCQGITLENVCIMAAIFFQSQCVQDHSVTCLVMNHFIFVRYLGMLTIFYGFNNIYCPLLLIFPPLWSGDFFAKTKFYTWTQNEGRLTKQLCGKTNISGISESLLLGNNMYIITIKW